MNPLDEPTPLARERAGRLTRASRALKVASARLRFVGVFAAVLIVVGGWETIRGYWDRLTTVGRAAETISSDTEFFCPMDPGILSDWPSKCPICNMTLVKHKRGEATPLPDGILARMQFTPYRLWLGGIRTGPIDYAPLNREIEAPGTVIEVSKGAAKIEAEVFGREIPWLSPGVPVEVRPADEAVPTLLPGKVENLPARAPGPGEAAKVAIGVSGGADGYRKGDSVLVRMKCPAESIEPFRSQPAVPPPLASGEPRRLYSCMDHADVVRDEPGRCPRDQTELMARDIPPNGRVRWWCPMHPEVTADRKGAKCAECGGMVLVPRVNYYRPPGKVLAIPSSAVIEDGSRTLVYVESGAGMFDAKAVTLGPRCGDQFPVVAGLEPGDRVALQGAFLIDAETRLNPSLAAGYFGAGAGASGREKAEPAPSSAEPEWLRELPAADRPLALRQKICPVTGKPLGSMGVPGKLAVKGRDVFVCCDGCSPAIEANPSKYLAKLPSEVRP